MKRGERRKFKRKIHEGDLVLINCIDYAHFVGLADRVGCRMVLVMWFDSEGELHRENFSLDDVIGPIHCYTKENFDARDTEQNDTPTEER